MFLPVACVFIEDICIEQLSVADASGLEIASRRGVTLSITFIEPDVMLARTLGPFVLCGWVCASRSSGNGLGGRRRRWVHEHLSIFPF